MNILRGQDQQLHGAVEFRTTVGRVLRGSDISSKLLVVTLDFHAPENTNKRWSDVFASVAVKEPPLIVP